MIIYFRSFKRHSLYYRNLFWCSSEYNKAFGSSFCFHLESFSRDLWEKLFVLWIYLGLRFITIVRPFILLFRSSVYLKIIFRETISIQSDRLFSQATPCWSLGFFLRVNAPGWRLIEVIAYSNSFPYCCYFKSIHIPFYYARSQFNWTS